MSEVIDQIREWLKSEGFELGCYGTCGHSCGLPPCLLVKPGFTPVDGAYALAVTATEVLAASCLYPSNHNDWRIRRRTPYTSKADLKQILTESVQPPKGCW